MIVVRVELHSARTGKRSVIGLARIWNEATGTSSRGNYRVEVFRRNGKGSVVRTGRVRDYPMSYSVWRLVIRALRSAFLDELR